eukprot:12890071-Alexandrium_andersonii.AAC.1
MTSRPTLAAPAPERSKAPGNSGTPHSRPERALSSAASPILRRGERCVAVGRDGPQPPRARFRDKEETLAGRLDKCG